MPRRSPSFAEASEIPPQASIDRGGLLAYNGFLAVAGEGRRAFSAFLRGLLGDFNRYAGDGHVDLRREGVDCLIAGICLGDVEFVELITVEVLGTAWLCAV